MTISEDTETSGEMDHVPPGPGRAGWEGIGFALAAAGVVAVAIVVWITHLGAGAARGPRVATVGPPVTIAGTGSGSGSAAGSGAAGSGAAGVSSGQGGTRPSSPLGRIDRNWAAKAAAATGIPGRAFLAYASADLTVAQRAPSCGLGWNTLAAIGTVESANGTYGGTTILASGFTSKPIIGVPLAGGKLGGGTVAAIPDTDHGRLDGDSRWDHAVGPLQFIPATWAKWGADGNGDGVASPDQIDDAALAAARYLCASGSMTSPSGWRAAVFSYNQSNDYVNEVANIANQYAADVSGSS